MTTRIVQEKRINIMDIYTTQQQLIDPKKLIKFLQEVDEEYAKTYGEHCIVRVIMNKVEG
jgi:hypothetical protein